MMIAFAVVSVVAVVSVAWIGVNLLLENEKEPGPLTGTFHYSFEGKNTAGDIFTGTMTLVMNDGKLIDCYRNETKVPVPSPENPNGYEIKTRTITRTDIFSSSQIPLMDVVPNKIYKLNGMIEKFMPPSKNTEIVDTIDGKKELRIYKFNTALDTDTGYKDGYVDERTGIMYLISNSVYLYTLDSYFLGVS